jgi:hypothetical protein
MARNDNPTRLTPELEEELKDRLTDVLDEIDDVAEKRRRLNRHLGGHLKVLGETKDLVRRQLKGIDLDQLEIPGTERPEPSKDPITMEILRIAGGIVTKKAPADETPEPLVWRGKEETGIVVANVIGGTYRLERNEGTREGWTAKWTPGGGAGGPRQKLLAIGKPFDECKEACLTHHLDRAGSDLLEKGGG